jgi:zinc transporter ZupT
VERADQQSELRFQPLSRAGRSRRMALAAGGLIAWLTALVAAAAVVIAGDQLAVALAITACSILIAAIVLGPTTLAHRRRISRPHAASRPSPR